MTKPRTLKDMLNDFYFHATGTKDYGCSECIVSYSEIKKALEPVGEALKLSHGMFVNRDRMNSYVHDCEIRLSPITIKVEQALNTLNEFIGDKDAK